jgi:hypothetical protein
MKFKLYHNQFLVAGGDTVTELEAERAFLIDLANANADQSIRNVRVNNLDETSDAFFKHLNWTIKRVMMWRDLAKQYQGLQIEVMS